MKFHCFSLSTTELRNDEGGVVIQGTPHSVVPWQSQSYVGLCTFMIAWVPLGSIPG